MESNLTESATHLIAREPGSDKYVWAVKLGMPVMRPSWLYDLRDRWMKADPIHFGDLIEEHRLDTFEGLTMAMAGVTDMEKRKDIRSKVKSASGQTPLTFKLDGSFTHLLCEDAKSSETLQVVKKYIKKADRYRRRGEEVPEDAPEAEKMLAALKLKLVWVDWVEDCLAVQGCIEERLYLISEPRLSAEQRQRLVKNILDKRTETAKRTAASMRHAEAALANPVAAAPEVKGKISKQNVPRAVAKRPNMAIEQLMEHIAHVTPENREPSPVETEKVGEARPQEAKNVLQRPVQEGDGASELKLERSTGKCSITAPNDTENDVDEGEEMEVEQAAGLAAAPYLEKSLSQVSFRIDLRDVAKNERVFEALRNQGITQLLQANDPQQADFHVLPLVKLDVESHKRLGEPVTHFFIERCLTEERILRLDESFALQPARHVFPLPVSDVVWVALTGLGGDEDGPDRHQVEVALDTAGIRKAAVFKRGVHTHLLVGKLASGSKSSDAKIDRAKKWGVPIVGLDFINRIYRDGVISPAPALLTNGPRLSEGSLSGPGDTSAASQEPSTMLKETQAIDLASADRHGTTLVPKDADLNAQTWQRANSDSLRPALTMQRLSTGIAHDRAVDSEPPANHREKIETQQSLELGTQMINTSSEQVMALLNNRIPTGGPTVLSAALGPTNGRKIRRLPPSMRSRFRQSSRTPSGDDGLTTTIGAQEAPSVQDAEQMLAKGREQEAWALLQASMGHSTQSVNPFTSSQDEESMRVVYDDPAARRERRKIAAMIDKAVNSKEKQDGDEDENTFDSFGSLSQPTNGVSPQQHIAPRSAEHSPLKRARTTVAGFSPTIKARRQPGTANRDA